MTTNKNQQTRTQTEALQRSIKVRKRAAEIARSLISEDYVLVSQSNACETITLHHRFNGNRMTVKCGVMGVYVWKNNILKKIELL